MTWAQEQRQAFIHRFVTEQGQIRRKNLVDAFRISTPQASVDLRIFQRNNPGVLAYDPSRKAYVRRSPAS